MDDGGQPTAYWPVGYPAVLAASYVLLGRNPASGILLQVLLGAATCVLVSRSGTSAFGVRVGRLSALLLAAYPTHVFYATLYLTEPLFALETDGVLWNLKGLAAPPSPAVTLVLLGVANAAYLCMLSFAVLGLIGVDVPINGRIVIRAAIRPSPHPGRSPKNSGRPIYGRGFVSLSSCTNVINITTSPDLDQLNHDRTRARSASRSPTTLRATCRIGSTIEALGISLAITAALK